MAKTKNEDLANLMELLDEQDESLFVEISENIQTYGLVAIPYLEATGEKSLDDIVIKRIKKLIGNIRLQNLYRELHNWSTLNSNDLLKGYFIISKYLFPDLDEERVMAKVEALKKEVWLELKKDMTPFEEAKVISKVFFEVRKFKFNQNATAVCDSLCLNVMLNSGQGFPDGFSVLYAGIAQRLGIPIFGVKMPESMFLGYVYSNTSQVPDLKNDLRFYINPFRAGLFFQKEQIQGDLVRKYPEDFETYFGACRNQDFIIQILNMMNKFFTLRGKTRKAEDVFFLKKALEVE